MLTILSCSTLVFCGADCHHGETTMGLTFTTSLSGASNVITKWALRWKRIYPLPIFLNSLPGAQSYYHLTCIPFYLYFLSSTDRFSRFGFCQHPRDQENIQLFGKASLFKLHISISCINPSFAESVALCIASSSLSVRSSIVRSINLDLRSLSGN